MTAIDDRDGSPIRAVVFDGAGTLIDFGCSAPVHAFRRAFAEYDIDASEAQVREPMGRAKRAHIRAMLAMPTLSEQWQTCHGKAPDEAVVDAIHDCFEPLATATAAEHATLIPGALETIGWLRERGVRIGTTTGYTRAIMQPVLPEVERQGFVPDALVCSDDVVEGRPSPEGMRRCMELPSIRKQRRGSRHRSLI